VGVKALAIDAESPMPIRGKTVAPDKK